MNTLGSALSGIGAMIVIFVTLQVCRSLAPFWHRVARVPGTPHWGKHWQPVADLVPSEAFSLAPSRIVQPQSLRK